MKFQPVIAIFAALVAPCFAMDQPSFHTKGAPVGKPIGPVKPGQYWWKPGLSPRGPVVVLVSLPQQTMHVCIATAFSSAARASAAAARATPRRRGYSTFSRRRKRITRKSMIMPRCRTCSGSPGLASPCTLVSCLVIRPATVASDCHMIFRRCFLMPLRKAVRW